MQTKGFIDIHTHGINGYDTKTTNPEHILKMAQLHGRAGTAAILPTIYSAPIDEMRKNMEAVKKAMNSQGSGIRGQGSGDKKLTIINYFRCSS